MEIFIEPIGKLINEFSKLPGVGKKTAQRFAYKIIDMSESEARAFADRILCPTAILNFLGVNSAEEIAEICGVDMEMAKRRYVRLCRARHFDKKRRNDNGRGTFLLNGIERLLYENMKDFIEANKKPQKKPENEE